MPFEALSYPRRSVAVIGGGISGLGAAWMLAPTHNVTVYEAEPRMGGHARTRWAGVNRDQAVDTGFIVFNHVNYPQLMALFDRLDVPVVKSDMTFGASVRGGALEYGLKNLRALFAQPKNAADPRFLRMIRDVLRFNATALGVARQDQAMTVGGLLAALGTGEWFRDYYLLPLSGAIWSTPTEKILDFPAHAMMQFFENHALLHHSGQHQWYTVAGGSVEYVTRLVAGLQGWGVQLRPDTPVAGLRRVAGGVEVRAHGGEWEMFDDVVLATHSDDSLRLLVDPSEDETRILSAVKYQPNDIVLHSDPSVMPRRRAVWSSWNYTEAPRKTVDTIDLTYWMNSLQPWLKQDDLFVTLNTTRPIRQELIWDQVTLRHPVYDLAALEAQKQVPLLNGQRNTWFCGAWCRNGFHEDGLSSAVDVAQAMLARNAQRVAAE